MSLVDAAVVALVASSITLLVLHPLAHKLNLLDRPDSRKHHNGAVPMIGGLSIMLGLLVGALAYGNIGRFEGWLLATAAVLVITGVVDDRHPLRVRERVLVQSALIVIMMVFTSVYVHELGTLYHLDAQLGWLGVPFTLVALIGLLNAFNLADGIDGLAIMLTWVAAGGILLTVGADNAGALGALLAFLMIATMPQLAGNLGLFGARHKSFLGDAGSTLLGYMVGWALIYYSQQRGSRLSPVGALWCVAIPVFDTLSVMLRRIRVGMSPFKPGRRHIHYMLMDAGLGPRLTLLVLAVAAFAMWGIGDGVRALHLGSGTNLAAFCILLVAYIGATARMETWLRARGKVGTLSGTHEPNGDPQPPLKSRVVEPISK